MKFCTYFLKSCVVLCINFLLCGHNGEISIVCNGSAKLAEKRYNEVAYATTHNGQSFKRSLVQNQDKTITEQLEAGIRALKIPLWYGCDDKGNKIVCACHGMSKSLLYYLYEEDLVEHVPYIFKSKVKKVVSEIAPAMKALREALLLAYGEQDSQQGLIPFPHGMFDPACDRFKNICIEIKRFLDAHPCEIVTLIVEDFTNNMPLVAADIQESGLFSYAHRQQEDKPWPTLAAMVKANKRMVIFVRTQDEVRLRQYPWLSPLWNYAWDTRFSFKRMAEFKYDVVPNRGAKSFEQRNTMPYNKLFIVYHFITPFVGGNKKWAMKVNKGSVLKRRLSKLVQQTGHIPNFVQVDFFEYPHNDIFKIINELNGIV
jgi:hypothetical protein